MHYIFNHSWRVEVLLASPGVGAIKCKWMEMFYNLQLQDRIHGSGAREWGWSRSPPRRPSVFSPLPCTFTCWLIQLDQMVISQAYEVGVEGGGGGGHEVYSAPSPLFPLNFGPYSVKQNWAKCW